MQNENFKLQKLKMRNLKILQFLIFIFTLTQF